MRRHNIKFGLILSLGALAFTAACQPAAQESASTSPPAAEATNAVAPTAEASPTNAVAPPTNAVAAAPAAGVVTLAVVDATGATLSGDPAKGAGIYRQCQSCHAKEAGVNKVGPSLAGLVGRKVGSVPGFRYSEANKASGLVWSEQELYVYLENPRAVVPGTTMAFVGIKDSQKRADLIAYLKSIT
jgi:cytochrome c